ncbi:MAG: TRAP transporter substrate-binding protein [Spirochaetes bacterium]|nr:MAG: TRAP transporter substrate-binding protein [Spirochaetota bacterium]
MKKLWRSILVFVMFIIAGMLFAGGQTESAKVEPVDTIKPITLTWTAGGMGGGWYTTAGGMARIINEVEPNLTIKVIPGGGLANPLKLSEGQDDIGWGVSYVDKAAYTGLKALFDRKYDNFYGLAGNFSVDFYHYLAAKSTGVTTFEQFVQKIKNGEKIKVALSPRGTSDYALTTMLLDYYGLSLESIEAAGGRVTYAVYGDMVNIYKDRHVDYAFACLGLPGAAITEMAISRPSILMSIEDKVIDHFAEKLGTVPLSSGVSFVPAGTYTGMDMDIQTIGHSTQICASSTLPDNIAYLFVKVLMEKIEEVKSLHPGFQKYFTRENAPNTSVPLHPGAEKYYREVGLIK